MQWFHNGVALADRTDSTLHLQSIPSDTGLYQFQVSTMNGCAYSEIHIAAYPLPDVSFSVDPLESDPPLFVQFTNTTPGAQGETAFWDLANGTTTAVTSPSVTYGTPGIYDVVLVMTTAAGCADSASVGMSVGATDVPNMPNVFSPNGDGVNDAFLPILPFTEPFRLTIYNRWGQQLFGTSELMQGWDGHANGVEVPDGTYFWTLNALHAEASVQHLTGTVTLLRDRR